MSRRLPDGRCPTCSTPGKAIMRRRSLNGVHDEVWEPDYDPEDVDEVISAGEHLAAAAAVPSPDRTPDAAVRRWDAAARPFQGSQRASSR